MTGNTLINRSVVVTREQSQAGTTANRIEELGGTAVLFPTIKVIRLEDRTLVRDAVQNIDGYDWLIFTSVNAVTCFDELFDIPLVTDLDCRVAAIGTTTAKALRLRGLEVDLIPDRFSSEGLLDALDGSGVAGLRFLQPCSRIARNKLAEGLRSRGAEVNRVRIYDTIPNRNLDAEGMINAIKQGKIDCLTFFSPSSFEFFIDIVGKSTVNLIKDKGIPIAVLGSTTARAIEPLGINNLLRPSTSNEEALIQTMVDYYATRS